MRLNLCLRKFGFLLSEKVDTGNHILDELVLSEADATPVTHIDAVSYGRVLAHGAPRLAVVLAAQPVDCLEADLGDELRHLDVHRAAHARAEIARAAGQCPELRVNHENLL
mmetsp:Transcript_42581/g.56207  ORF Transcript_42581/g.56207 Transcript_42581/m.56207 type:complete len:111 (-) Transcript_42581:1112-1444(-)|eukprot:CAMPEP_0185576118 /NCGR_PEP_ID=MMETSP0434-20130131/7116_1 /TAXON_ID=626734 ORGANISM="Favella taraikaensis, Strain Fe Narragansett Bay" /NCGR_SAMPLE_ID=MMETSP0434 /ASSEMBLY_ACC=CAM_ASM_000379 /LENGTH=110 /DNA_ID=CAMNT_0028193199 /DNA_START=109 /DNA_END=441 /DNA_ORIENTATION=+